MKKPATAAPMVPRVHLRVSPDAQDLERQERIITAAKAAADAKRGAQAIALRTGGQGINKTAKLTGPSRVARQLPNWCQKSTRHGRAISPAPFG